MYYLFEKSEYESRWQKCQQEMDRRGLDVLILSQGTNLIYMTGYRTGLYNSNFRPFICVLPKGGQPALLVPNLEGGAARKESWFDDVRTWGPGCEAPGAIELVKKYFTEKNLLKSRVGMELGQGQRLGMTQEEYDNLRAALSGCEFKTCGDLMWALRRVKSKKEIEFLREACRISNVAFEAAVDVIKAGISEKEIQRAMGRAMLEEGGELQGSIIVASGEDRYDMLNPKASNRIIKNGDMVVLDFGSYYNGYRSDITRGVFVSPILPRQKELYEAAYEIQKAALTAAKPGNLVGAIDDAARKAIVDMGYEKLMLHRSGHSLGLDGHEMPSVAAGDQTALEPGMCLAIEPALYDFTIGQFRIEDDIVITSDGFSYLSECRREVIIK